jgi:thioredoxin-like negative regulator of GroEL
MEQLFRDADIKKELKKVDFTKIDCDLNPDLVKEYSVGVLPTYIFIKKGKIVARYTGGFSKSGFIRIISKHAP